MKSDLIFSFAFKVTKELELLKSGKDFAPTTRRGRCGHGGDDNGCDHDGYSGIPPPVLVRLLRDAEMFYEQFKFTVLERSELITTCEKLIRHYSKLNENVSYLGGNFILGSDRIIVT